MATRAPESQARGGRRAAQPESPDLAICGDVAGRQRLDEEARHEHTLEALGDLAGRVAHDFNNLLTSILGFSELLLEDVAADASSRPDLEAIHAAAVHGASLTRQLLAFSGRQILEPTMLDLGALAHGLRDALHRSLGDDVDIVVTGEPALWSVKADRGQIEQAVANVAANGRDAMPEGGRLTIAARNVTLDENNAARHPHAAVAAFVELAISDTGVGMDAATRARIFEPFFTTKANGKGTGLGLSTAYGIVRQSGGHIDVHSEVGRGATFKLYFPAVKEETGRHDEINPTAAASGDAPTSGGTILIVEDDDALRDMLCRSLEQSGFVVIEAACASEALERVQRGLPQLDLLVTDVVMPGMSGTALAREVMALRPGIQVLLISGYTDEVMVQLGWESTGKAFLQKPFGPVAFVRKVRGLLESAAQEGRTTAPPSGQRIRGRRAAARAPGNGAA